MGDPEHYRYSSREGYLPPVPQKETREVGEILRRLGYVKDKHQRRENGKKQKRKWRRAGDDVGHDVNVIPPKPAPSQKDPLIHKGEPQEDPGICRSNPGP